MWIKICGNTNLEDARHAIDAGADALGFVFAPSARRVTRDQVASITALLPPRVETYGVFGDAGFDEIVAAVDATGLSGVQLHGGTDTGLPLQLRTRFDAQEKPVRILSVLHLYPDAAAGLSIDPLATLERQLTSLAQDHAVDAALVDSHTATASGGTGLTFNWQAAQQSIRRVAPHLRIVVAGGLRPENVAEAILTLRPWGVDVVSGVEASPGRKDPARVSAFIRNAKEAFALQGDAATEAMSHRTR